MNIFQRLNAVREKVGYLKKDTTVQGYKAITHDFVTAAVRPHFIEHGIMMVVGEISHTLENTGKQTSQGTPITRWIGTYSIRFFNIEDPVNDQFEVIISAIGEDTADKGPGKAISYASKYAILKVLNIETGESEESRIEADVAYITEDQKDQLMLMLEEGGLVDNEKYLERFYAYMKVKGLLEIKANDYDKAVKAINAAVSGAKKSMGQTDGKGKSGQQSLL